MIAEEASSLNSSSYMASPMQPFTMTSAKKSTVDFDHIAMEEDEEENYEGAVGVPQILRSGTASNSKNFAYEPALYSLKQIKAWEGITGRRWYEMSPTSRSKANFEIRELVEAKRI